ncbi:thiamine phosphate synthase [Pseudoflavitalea sp. X16]|uniref:thiamine phosphate synthase n=1 Tax=Paraflavitalea devenefica TaxID=2716334 RepID=UPI00141E5624|nr:thiamine phosphate synthase [Paraflavitalea devenefica]NII24588.1 thiamine phosphate synthase [Paraflavitalea devenefica]
MRNHTRAIRGGLYLVIDPAKGWEKVLPAVQQAIAGGIDIIQVWNHWHPEQQKTAFIEKICRAAHPYHIPVLMNEDWQLMNDTSLDGVHFDEIPASIDAIRQQVQRPFWGGITCGNDLQKVQWAVDNRLDYISFCSMFPSATANSCELVKIETVQAARALTNMPIFLAGGITPDNLSLFEGTGMNGVAVISGIMNAEDPQQKTHSYKQALHHIQQKTP